MQFFLTLSVRSIDSSASASDLSSVIFPVPFSWFSWFSACFPFVSRKSVPFSVFKFVVTSSVGTFDFFMRFTNLTVKINVKSRDENVNSRFLIGTFFNCNFHFLWADLDIVSLRGLHLSGNESEVTGLNARLGNPQYKTQRNGFTYNVPNLKFGQNPETIKNDKNFFLKRIYKFRRISFLTVAVFVDFHPFDFWLVWL